MVFGEVKRIKNDIRTHYFWYFNNIIIFKIRNRENALDELESGLPTVLERSGIAK